MARTCPWNRFTRAEYSCCEADLCAWIVHPAETWSNLAFIAVAVWLVARRLDLGAAIVLNQAAAVALWLDRGKVGCFRGVLTHIVQPHSFWHVLSALSLLFFYRFERQIEHAVHDPGGNCIKALERR